MVDLKSEAVLTNLQSATVLEDRYSVQDYPMVHMAAIQKSYNANLAHEFRALEITPQIWRVLATLQEKEGHTLGLLSEITLIEQSHLSRMIDSMEREKLVTRKSQSRDKRFKLVHLTSRGRQLFEELLPTALAQYDMAFRDFSEQEKSQFMDFLKRARTNLSSNIR